jgi:hypothetical protein
MERGVCVCVCFLWDVMMMCDDFGVGMGVVVCFTCMATANIWLGIMESKRVGWICLMSYGDVLITRRQT